MRGGWAPTLPPSAGGWLAVCSHTVSALVLLKALQRFGVGGGGVVVAEAVAFLRSLPGVAGLVERVLEGEVRDASRKLLGPQDGVVAGKERKEHLEIPAEGVPARELVREVAEMRRGEDHAARGRAFAYLYFSHDDHHWSQHSTLQAQVHRLCSEGSGHNGKKHDELLAEIYNLCSESNALNPTMFPSLRRMENEALSMVCWLLHGPRTACGSITSGGTESILMALKAYRELAKATRPWVQNMEIVLPVTAHPAFEKGAFYFGFRTVHVPVERRLGMRPDIAEVRKRITRNTVLIVASAPAYPHVVIDPIEEMGRVAEEFGLPLHVDACYGGFALPWLERLGHDVGLWDFRTPAVTSISADFHKYGYAEKGASAIVWRTEGLRQHQYYSYSRWPGGIYVSPSMAGTRPGGNVACAWAAMRHLGQRGYLEATAEVRGAVEEMVAGVRAAGLRLVAEPQSLGFAFEAAPGKGPDILAVADAMEEKGWKMERQSAPACLHCTVMPMHVRSAGRFAADLVQSVAEVRRGGRDPKAGTAAMYGMMAAIPDKTVVDDFTKKVLSTIYTYG